MTSRKFVLALIVLCFVMSCAAVFMIFAPRDQQEAAKSVAARYLPMLRQLIGQQSKGTLPAELKTAGFELGQPIVLRIFKQESALEIWMMRNDKFDLFKIYPICKWSGELGPKLKEGDGQSPEGFYEVSSQQLNPGSRYHLAFNLGFPNAYDQSLSRTGSALMVHGSCVSIGCYAMTDAGIEDIYTTVAQALLNGQTSVPVQIFPFRMTQRNLDAHAPSPWAAFWKNLAEGDAIFQKTRQAPKVFACNGRYHFRDAPTQCEQVRGW